MSDPAFVEKTYGRKFIFSFKIRRNNNGDEIEKGTPDPEPYLKAVKALGVPKENRIVLENAVSGITSAVKAGLTCLAIKNGSPILSDVLKEAGVTEVYRNIAEFRSMLLKSSKRIDRIDNNLRICELLKIFP